MAHLTPNSPRMKEPAEERDVEREGIVKKPRPFLLVDAKIAQANYFLGRLARTVEAPFEFHCYLSAFVAAARSVTYVLQAVMSRTQGFAEWYAKQQAAMRRSAVAHYFHALRRLDHHIGANPVAKSCGTSDGLQGTKYSFGECQEDDMPQSPKEDVLTACHAYFDEVALVVVECCIEFQIPMDPKVHFTKLNFDSLGQSIGDAIEELTGDCDATLVGLVGESNQWLLVREAVWSTDLFMSYERLRPPTSPTG